jgi:dTDP-4-dehydrorhamnose reductase
MKKAIVFGASGQLGAEIGRVMEARGYETRRLDRKEVDISDARQVDEAIGLFDPSLVFNCAAYNQVDLAESEPQAAFAANAIGVRNLALACRQADATLVHYSTDYVFDGTLGRPYVETDATHPLGVYAVSKLTGELFVQAYLDRALIIRTSGVFGPAGVRSNRGNFVELMLRLANAGQPIKVVEDHIASPTYAPFLAEKSVELVLAETTGVFHIGGGAPISWFDYARMIFEIAGLHPVLTATNAWEYRTPARRPRFSALANARMEASGIPPIRPLREALELYMHARLHYLM